MIKPIMQLLSPYSFFNDRGANSDLKYIFCGFHLLHKYLVYNYFEFYNCIIRHALVYKQLGSGLSPQSCLYFQGFPVSKLLNGCFVV